MIGKIIDWDKDPDVDATVFFRANRSGETWNGYKIQGIGHDGQRASKERAIQKIQELLGRRGWWIESSDAMQHVLSKLNVRKITDQNTLAHLFGKIQMNKDGSYSRQLESGLTITEMVFGHPVLI